MGKISQHATQHDDFWADTGTEEGNAAFDRLRGNQEWDKLSEQFFNAGYREGISAGKESVIQASFDEGFADVGAPLGRTIGNLRGVATAAIALIGTPTVGLNEETRRSTLEELKKLRAELDGLRFDTSFPEGCDEHEHEQAPSGSNRSEEGERPKISPAEQILNVESHAEETAKMYALKERLRVTLCSVGFDDVISLSS